MELGANVAGLTPCRVLSVQLLMACAEYSFAPAPVGQSGMSALWAGQPLSPRLSPGVIQ